MFRDLSFRLEAGEIMAVTGPNGSGKSTLVRILAGVLSPTKGVVKQIARGREVPEDRRSQAVGLVAPYLQLYDGLTLEENLRFVLKVRLASHGRAEVQDLMRRVALGDRAADLVGTFSSGMKQRARFATALATGSDLLLLDEPSSNLDEVGVEMVKGIIDDAVNDGKAIILATNSAEEKSWCGKNLAIEDFFP